MGTSQAVNFPGQPQTLSPGLAPAPGLSPAIPEPVPECPILERLWLDLPPMGEARWELGSSQVVKIHVQHLLRAHSCSPRTGQVLLWPAELVPRLPVPGVQHNLAPRSQRVRDQGHLGTSQGLSQSRAHGATRCHMALWWPMRWQAVPWWPEHCHGSLCGAVVAHAERVVPQWPSAVLCSAMVAHAVLWWPMRCCSGPCSAMVTHVVPCSAVVA